MAVCQTSSGMFKVTTKSSVKGVTKVDWRERGIEKPRTKRIKA